MKTVYVFHVTNSQGEEAAWWVDMKVRSRAIGGGKQLMREGAQKKGRVGKVEKGGKAPLKPDVSIWVGDRDLVGLATGAVGPVSAAWDRRRADEGTLSLIPRSSMRPR